MLIHLLRHAEAEDVSRSGRDADRSLTSAGHARMEAIARAIARMDPSYDMVLVSTLVRARQTAEPVVKACGFSKEMTETAALSPSAPPEDVLHEIALGKPKTVLLVGHQPHVGRLFGLLATGRSDVELPMKKASLACFETGSDPSIGPAELKFYLPPRLLERLG
jgi:phosphohistidine phosphatase